MSSASDPAVPGHGPSRRLVVVYLAVVAATLAAAWAASSVGDDGTRKVLGRVPFDYVPFALTLLGVGMLHRLALPIALGGALAVSAYAASQGADLVAHAGHEARVLGNVFGLLVGFALLADHFERSGVPHRIPARLPSGAKGAFALLALVWVLSSFLDNIAAAMIGGVVAKAAFQGRVTTGYVAAIVAASNAGGAGSVVGDTTTTMMWIEGVPALRVAPAFLAAAAALLVAGTWAARAQTRVQPVVVVAASHAEPVDGARLGVVALVLAGAIATNVLLDFPAAGVWAALLLAAPLRAPDWRQVPPAAKGAVFLLSLVWAASLMPVKALPEPSWGSTLGLGFVSSIFDNIPLTKLAIQQNGYDWALLAFAVGYGGSMTWFGSSAGVAITKEFPQARDLGRYLKEGWVVVLAYVVGFFVFLALLGWNPWTIPPRG